jgi:hypothetical protein
MQGEDDDEPRTTIRAGSRVGKGMPPDDEDDGDEAPAAPAAAAAPPVTPQEVDLGPPVGKLRLKVPPSAAIRHELFRAAGVNLFRAWGAALGLANKKLGRKVRYTYNPLEYGGRVIDFLIAEGVPYKRIMAAGAIAWDLCTNDLTDFKEVDEAEGFSDPGEPAASTS